MENPTSNNKYKKVVGLRELKQLSEQRYFDIACPNNIQVRVRLSELIILDIKVHGTAEDIEIMMHDGQQPPNTIN